MNRTLHTRTLSLAAVLVILASPALVAQTQPLSPTSSASSSRTGQATFHTSNGTIVTVNSHHPDTKDVQPAPPFAKLDADGNGSIDTSEVNQYPPLANDFKYADSNHDNVISKDEYERWTGQP